MKATFFTTSMVLALLGTGISRTHAQQSLKIGTNPTMVNSSAVLDVESTSKGALLPRVALTGLTDVTTVANPANSVTVFNTATAGTGPNNVTPGYYFWNAARNSWVRLLTRHDARFENLVKIYADYTLTDTDCYVLVMCTDSADYKITLPDPTTCFGRVIFFKGFPEGGPYTGNGRATIISPIINNDSQLVTNTRVIPTNPILRLISDGQNWIWLR